MPYTQKRYERIYPLAELNPADKSAATYNTSWVSVSDYHRAWVVMQVGDMDASSTVDMKIQEATDTSGSGSQDISDKSITQLTQADGDDNSLVCIELQTEEMSVDSDYDCIRAQVTVANAASVVGLVIYGTEPRFMPVPSTAWTERVS